MHYQVRARRGDEARALHARRDLRRDHRPAAGLADLHAALRAWSSPPTTARCSTSRRASPTASRRSRTTPRSSTRSPSSTRRSTRAACAGTIRPSASPGRDDERDHRRARPELSGLSTGRRRRPMTIGELRASLDERGARPADARLRRASSIPICRSITGDGVRETLRRLQRAHAARPSTRCRAAPRSSTGRCRGSGTSATPG